MVPFATVTVIGAVGEISSASNAGEAVTCATGFGTTVVLGPAEELLLLDDLDSVEAPVGVWLTLSAELCATPRPDDELEHAAVAAKTPTATRAMAARRTGLYR
jgi:hypothetical protein